MVFNYVRRYFRARRAYWGVVEELACFSDYELSDIGVNRAEIMRLAKNAAAETWKEPPRPLASQTQSKHDRLEAGWGGRSWGLGWAQRPRSP